MQDMAQQAAANAVRLARYEAKLFRLPPQDRVNLLRRIVRGCDFQVTLSYLPPPLHWLRKRALDIRNSVAIIATGKRGNR